MMLHVVTPSPLRGEGWGEGSTSPEAFFLSNSKNQTSSQDWPLTLTLSPEGRGDCWLQH